MAGSRECSTSSGGMAADVESKPSRQPPSGFDKIVASLTALGGGIDDVVRTRVYLKDAGDWEAVSRVQGLRDVR